MSKVTEITENSKVGLAIVGSVGVFLVSITLYMSSVSSRADAAYQLAEQYKEEAKARFDRQGEAVKEVREVVNEIRERTVRIETLVERIEKQK